MRVAFYQMNPVFGDKEKNISQVEQAAARLKAELLVLPELFSTGYQFISEHEARSLAEPFPGGETLRRLAEFARKTGMAVAAGFLERKDEHVFNSAALIMPDAETEGGTGSTTGAGSAPVVREHGVALGLYRKVHLFADEKRWMQPGDLGFPVFRWRGTTLGLLICFDWFFPEAARALTLQGMELLLHPSNLVLPYCQDAMKTRALENGIFAITANRVGTEERDPGGTRLTFTGMSQVVGPKAEVLCRAGREEELRVVEVDLVQARAKQVTPRNHILEDRRPEFYRGLTS